jgi:hypothetical protein
MITKEEVISAITITEHGNMEVRVTTRVLEDGEILSEKYHRRVIEAGADVSLEPQELQQYASIAFTPKRVEAAIARRTEDDLDSKND